MKLESNVDVAMGLLFGIVGILLFILAALTPSKALALVQIGVGIIFVLAGITSSFRK